MRYLAALFLYCSIGQAEVVYAGIGAIAHIADGGGIQTEFTVTNLDDRSNNYRISFFDDAGNPLTLTTDAGTTTSLFGTLAPHASRTNRTVGTANIAAQGWASIQSTGTVGGSVTFRASSAPWTGSEAVVPIDSWRNKRFSLAFDHTDAAAVIGVAMVNPLNAPATVTVTFKGEDGVVIVTDTFNMGPHTHRTIATSSYPATASKRGTIEVSTSGTYMSVLALRFGPSAISSIVPLVSSASAAFDNGCPGCWDY